MKRRAATASSRSDRGCVVVLTTSYPRSQGDGAGHFVAAEVDQMISQGQRVAVVYPSQRRSIQPGNPLRIGIGCGALFDWPGAWPRLQRAPWKIAWAALFVLRARAAVHRLPAERVIAHWLIPTALPTCVGIKLPLEVVIHGSDARLMGRLPPAIQSAALSLLRVQGARLRFVAEHLKQRLRAPGLRRWLDNSVVQPSPIHVPKLEPPSALRAALGIPPHAFVALIVSRLISTKRVDVALMRAPLPPEAVLVVLGDGPERGRLERRFPQARFLRRCDRWTALRWMRAADVVLCASLQEGAPTVIREARALGTAVWCAPTPITEQWARQDVGIILCAELAQPPLLQAVEQHRQVAGLGSTVELRQ